MSVKEGTILLGVGGLLLRSATVTLKTTRTTSNIEIWLFRDGEKYQ
jgi:hypothetical protein